MSGNFKKLPLIAGLGLAAWLFMAADAHAFWGSWGSSGGSWGGSSGGSWGSSGGSSGGSWGSSGGSSGGWGRHHHRWFRKHHHWGGSSGGSWGSSGGYAYAGGSSGGSWGSSGGSSGGSWGSSGGSSGGSYGSSGGSSGYTSGYEVQDVIEQPAPPTEPGSPSDAPAAPAPAAEGTAPAEGSSAYMPVDADAVLLNVQVPGDAKVFVNGAATNSTGAARHYVSRGLKNNASYAYEIRAEVMRDGETVTETKQVVVVGGQRANVKFSLDGRETDRVARQPVKTTLLLRVPADAKVYLSGMETKSTGELREFSTAKLTDGQTWSDYAVRVELNRDGQTLTKETNLSLIGGETRELSVDFDNTAVAQR
ncbi:MAG: TIGR03000 domain-containing protein [Pirellulales bacterium]|nr:TIGR03000 domain-containing protein [Pirellulales bacterium]